MRSLLRPAVLVIAALALAVPSTAPVWRNDSANMELVRRWNSYLSATPFSDDVSGAAVSDEPALALDWSLGRDMPYGQKDGVGCLIGSEFVTQGGGWSNVTVRGVPPPKLAKDAPSFSPLFVYDLRRRTWRRGPDPLYVQGRGQGTCTNTSMYVISGYQKHLVDRDNPAVAATTRVARLHKPAGSWIWEEMPPLPVGGGRWLGAAGVVGDYLVVATGSNTSSFSVHDDMTADNDESAPPPAPLARLPGYRLRLGSSGAAVPAARWERIAPFPGGGLDCTAYAVVGAELYVFGGWRPRAASMAAWESLLALDVPVP